MLIDLKTKFYSLLTELGYNVTDNGDYVEKFPWLMLRTNGYKSAQAFNSELSSVLLVLDIFSSYAGEKEIIEIVENINQHLVDLRESDPDILYCYQKNVKILDDKSTGLVRKHGVVSYEFLLGQTFTEIKEEEEEINGSEE